MVVVRAAGGDPVVIRNDPFLTDGTPMPTRYWLVGPEERLAVDRLESAGGVRRAEAAVDPNQLTFAHVAYAAERDANIPAGWSGPRPAGGVGGTRTGVKCLHAHYAWYLAGGDDPVGKWVAAQLAGGSVAVSGGLVAAIDCGTNSTRLLVASADGITVERLMRITRLGEGVDRTRRLSPVAIERTVEALREFRAVADSAGVERVRITSTSAARDAANRDEFFAAAQAVVGARPELLSGEEEAALSFIGATHGLDPASGPWFVADVGGGSTELACGGSPGAPPNASCSLDIGCVRLTERFLEGDPPSPSSLSAARAHVADLLNAATSAQPGLFGAATFVGLAGTVAALAAIEQGLREYDRDRVHHHTLSLATVETLLEQLGSETSAARRRRPGIEPDRADVIVGGTIVVAEIMRFFRFDRCLTSEADILDGLAMSIAGGQSR